MKNRIKILLLSGLFITTAVSGVFGTANAYYMNASSTVTMCEETDALPESNCMTESGQTVLLKDWNLSDTSKVNVTAELTFKTKEHAVAGLISCDTESKYIKAIILDKDGKEVSKETKINIGANEESKFSLQLVINNEKIGELSESSTESINVNWTSEDQKSISAKFNIELNPVVEAETTTESITIEQDLFELRSTTISKTTPLLAYVYYPENVSQVEIGTDMSGEDNEFPPYTRYSVDGGENYTLLMEGGKINLNAYGTSKLLQLDFSACSNEWKDATCTFNIAGRINEAWSEVQEDQVQMQQADATALSVATGETTPIVGKDKSLVYNVTSNLSHVEYELEYLTKDGYRKVTKEDNVSVAISLNNGVGNITVSSNGGTASPGTYKMTVIQKYDNVEVETETVSFFVNYR